MMFTVTDAKEAKTIKEACDNAMLKFEQELIFS